MKDPGTIDELFLIADVSIEGLDYTVNGLRSSLASPIVIPQETSGYLHYHKETQRTPNANHSQAKSRRDSESFLCDDQNREIPLRKVHFVVFPTRQLRGRGVLPHRDGHIEWP